MEEIVNGIGSVVPPKYQSLLSLLVVIAMVLGRAYKALRNGGGLKGVWTGLIYGTNTPKPVDPPAPEGRVFDKLSVWLVMASVACLGVGLWTGCKSLDAGADPVVVRTEQFLQVSQGTFRFTLQVDQQDRGLWRTKAPAFHQFCEELRRPTPYPATSTNLLPQYRVALLSLNDLKGDYKAGRASSNAVLAALSVLQGLHSQASAWLTIVTNR